MEHKKSIYYHIPFCVKRCSYCDFNTYAGMEKWIPAYFQALEKETILAARDEGERAKIHTVFFGGGTPSISHPSTYSHLLEVVNSCFELDETAEISLEANPGTIRERDMTEFSRSGINRISLGVQSFHGDELQLLGRIHDRKDVLEAVSSIRKSGIRNLNLDLIYGLPGQTTIGWEDNLDQALSLDPEHLSLYCLTIEEGTPLFEAVRQGEVLPLPDDAAADMYELAMAKLAGAGYRHYEISNWAKNGFQGEDQRCQHNLQYWKNSEYYGFGAGAHGYIHNMRIANCIAISAYIRSINQEMSVSPARVESKEIPAAEQMQDEMMLGLRLLEEGVSVAGFKAKFGREMIEVFAKQITELLAKGLVKWRDGAGSALVLTRRGILLGNRVFMEFVGDDQKR